MARVPIPVRSRVGAFGLGTGRVAIAPWNRSNPMSSTDPGTSASSVRVAAVQMDIAFRNLAENRRRVVERIAEAAAMGTRLVVFPECTLTGYGFETREDAMDLARPVDPSLNGDLSAIARACGDHDCAAVVGLLERDGDRLFNACVFLDGSGLIGVHRKVHMPYIGADRFADPGDRPFAVHEAVGLRIGMLICYDGGFPEATRVLALAGADLLALPTNWPPGAETAAEHQMPCRALENNIYTVAANRIGTESGFTFIGRSSICATNGNILARAEADSEAILIADVLPGVARRKRLVRRPGLHEIDRFADRRPDFYGPIVEPVRDA